MLIMRPRGMEINFASCVSWVTFRAFGSAVVVGLFSEGVVQKLKLISFTNLSFLQVTCSKYAVNMQLSRNYLDLEFWTFLFASFRSSPLCSPMEGLG